MNYEPKDLERVEGIAAKANGNEAKAIQLATAMANKIGDADKALRRGNAAEDENYHAIAKVFFDRAKELGMPFGHVERVKVVPHLSASYENTTTLYQKDTKGRVKVWTMRVVNLGDMSDMVSTSGLQGGKMTKDITHITEGKNEGKANATTHYTQALAEAKSKIDAKIREGYVEDINAIKESSELGSGTPAPMLAQKFDPTGKQTSSKTLKKMGIEGKKGSVQPKIDGHRRVIKVTKDNAVQFTRKGDVAVQLPHIADQLVEFAEHVLGKLGLTEIWLDGEAFTDEVTFSELSSLLRKESGHTKEELEKRSKINLRLYDVMLPVGYEKRYEVIKEFANKQNIVLIENHEIVFTDAALQKLLDEFLAAGHEGAMLRQHGVGYENKRTWQLVKYKIFEDAEFTIVGGEESVKRGMLGAFIVRDGKGNEFNAALKFAHPERIEMWTNLKKYVGKKATVQYFGKSEYGIPRFPRAIAIREND